MNKRTNIIMITTNLIDLVLIKFFRIDMIGLNNKIPNNFITFLNVCFLIILFTTYCGSIYTLISESWIIICNIIKKIGLPYLMINSNYKEVSHLDELVLSIIYILIIGPIFIRNWMN